MKSDNITSVLVQFTKLLNIPLIKDAIYNELLIHPDYPRLLSISDIFRCNIAEIKATPTLLLNGHILPDMYQLKDLKYMLQ